MSDGLQDRLGGSIRRAPYLWLVTTILPTFVLNTPLFVLVNDRDDASTWLAIAAAVVIAYAVVVWFVLLPRVIARSRSTMTPSRIAVARWTFGISPYMVAYAAVVLGAEEWVYGPGWITSIVLLILAARDIRREERAAAETSA